MNAIKMKFVIIGDGGIGKTCLLYTFLKKGFPESYVPTVMDQFTVDLPFLDKMICVEICRFSLCTCV